MLMDRTLPTRAIKEIIEFLNSSDARRHSPREEDAKELGYSFVLSRQPPSGHLWVELPNRKQQDFASRFGQEDASGLPEEEQDRDIKRVHRLIGDPDRFRNRLVRKLEKRSDRSFAANIYE